MIFKSFPMTKDIHKLFSFDLFKKMEQMTGMVLGLLILAVSFSQAQDIQKNTSVENGDTMRLYERLSLPNQDTIYPVLYETLSENKLAEAIGYLKGEKLNSTPSGFISNAFTGRIAGVYTEQISGEPGNNGVNVFLRGQHPIVLVDGVPRDLYSINPEQIESVTVLKDALSTAMLGMRGMNGAVLITTRKGENIPGFRLDVKAQTGIAAPIRLPKPLSAYDYARLYNEALSNDDKPPLYSDADLEAYKNGTDPFGHPNISWYDKILKKQSPFSRFTLNAGGSNEAMHYFVSLDYLNQDGLLKTSPVNTYNTNIKNQRYIFRSNVEVNLTKKLSMFLNLFGRIHNQNAPGGGSSNLFTALRNTPANAYPVFNPDSSLGGNVNFDNNIYGQSVLSGYTKTIYSDGYADLGLKYNMDDVLKGWWIKGKISYNLILNQQIDRSKDFETFQMRIDPTTGDTSYQRYGTKSDQRNSSNVFDRAHRFYAEFSTGYSHYWGNNALDILLMYNIDNFTENSDLPNKYKTLAGKIRYSYQHKYVLEAAASYSGNNRYEPGNRFGVFPAIGAAWNIQNENFFNKEGFINKLKLRASYGLTGNAVAGYFQYVDRYGGASGYHFGTSASSVSGRSFKQPLDVHTWEKSLKLDVGLDVGFSENRGILSIDYYHDHYKDLAQSRNRNSALLGWGENIIQNLGENLYSGLEITAGWSSAGSGGPSDHTSSFNYYISGNLSISDSKILFNDEPDYPYTWMQKTGHQVGQIYGYVADGFVTEPGQGPVMAGYHSIPGDIKYKDLNNDGVIDQFDRKAIGSQKPLLFYGVDIGFAWKNLSLTFLIQGIANRNLLLTGSNEWEFQNNGKGQAWQHHLHRWTKETAATATYPRLTAGTNINNHVTSSFWIRSGNYLRLKNAELAWSFHHINFWAIKIERLRLFVNGFNLLTASDFTQTDPETPADIYPNQRMVNGGISLRF